MSEQTVAIFAECRAACYDRGRWMAWVKAWVCSNHTVGVSSRPLLAKPYLTRLSGWGANTRADCDLRVPELEGQVRASLDPRGTVPRGLGRSYGDAALNSGGRVLGMTSFNRYLAFDDATGTLSCEAGVSLEHILRDFAPHGWFPMVTPGHQVRDHWWLYRQ